MVESESSPRSRSTFKRDWTKGSIISNLLLLSWPMVVMETLYVVSQIVDMIWVGRLGSAAIAGVGMANIILMLIMAMDLGLIVGVRAMIARFVGAGDLPGARHVAGQAFILSAVWGVLVTTTGFLLAGPVMGLFGLEAEVIAEGMAYMRVMFAGWVALEILLMGLYVIQSSGDTITPMMIEFIMRVIHVTLCPFLVLGLWVFPRLGVSGAALSNVIPQVLGAVIGLVLLFGGRTRLRLTPGDFRFAPDIIWRILKIGIPALVMNLQRAFGNLVLAWFIVPFGTLAVAAHSLVTRVEMFLFMPGIGLGLGAGVLVGQNLGAGQPKRAERSAWLAVGILEAFMLAASIAILLWAENIIGIFTREPGLVELSSAFLRLTISAYLVVAFVNVLQNCIAGAGDTLPNMIASIAMIWVVTLPLAFVLSRYTALGVYGIRWALVIGMFAGVIAYVVYFRLGRWKRKKV